MMRFALDLETFGTSLMHTTLYSSKVIVNFPKKNQTPQSYIENNTSFHNKQNKLACQMDMCLCYE